MPQLFFAALLCLLCGPLDAVAIPALLPPRALSNPSVKTLTSTHSLPSTTLSTEAVVSATPSSAIQTSAHLAPSSTNPPEEELCTYATVTVISTEISVSTKTHTVTERVGEPTRPRADKRGVCTDCTALTEPHSTSTNSSTSTTHTRTTAPELAITRRADEKAECDKCPTAAMIPAPLNAKTTSASPSTASTTKSTKKTTSKTSGTTSFGNAHSIHFDRRTATVLPGHPKHENSPTHD